MNAAAVDLIKLTQLDPPAPPTTAAKSDVAAPSFHEHLQQAKRRGNDDATKSEPNEDSNSGHEGAAATAPKPQADRPEKSPSDGNARQVADPQGKQADNPDEHAADDDGKAAEAPNEEVVAPTAVAAAVVVVPTNEHPTTVEPQIAEVREIAERPLVEGAAKEAVRKAATNVPIESIAAAPVADATSVADAATTEKATTRPIEAPDTATKPTETQTTTIAETVAEPEAAIVTPTRHVKSAETEIEATVQTTTRQAPDAVNAASAASTTETRPDDAPTRTREKDAGKQTTERTANAPSPPTAVEADPTNAAPSPAVEVVVAAAAADVERPAPASTTERSNSADESTMRHDRPLTAEPTRPAGQREFGLGRTTATDETTTLSQADRMRLVQRVARAVQTAQERGGDLRLRLSPPELGSLRLQVRLTDGALSARIEADNPAAKQVLIDHLPALRERLAEQNIRVERFDVDLSNSGGGGASQMPQQRFDDAGNRGGRTVPGPSASAQNGLVGDETVVRNAATVSDDGRLNVVV